MTEEEAPLPITVLVFTTKTSCGFAHVKFKFPVVMLFRDSTHVVLGRHTEQARPLAFLTMLMTMPWLVTL